MRETEDYMKMISVIVPCYNEEATLPYFYPEMSKVMEKVRDYNFEILFVDDGSKDGTLAAAKALADKDERVKYISFSRNFGKEAAIYAGLSYAKGDYVVMMDADLQDPPSLLPTMLHAVVNEGYDSVATRRVSRKGEPKIRSFFARMFYKIINRLSETEVVDGARDYRLMTRQFVNSILDMKEYNRFSKGLFGWVGYKTKWLEYENVERVAGESKWSFWKLFAYSIEGIVGFSTKPLLASAVIGVLMSVVSVVMILFIVIRTLIFGDPTPGWPSMACVILLVGGLQLFFMGIIGEYLAKTYMEIKNRPIFICRETNIHAEEKKIEQ